MMFLIKTNFFHEFSWFWDFQNKKQKQTPSRENQKKLGEKKEKHLLKQKILFQVEKLFFWFYLIFFRFFCFLGRVFGFLVLEVKKSKKTHGKSTYHFTYVFLFFKMC